LNIDRQQLINSIIESQHQFDQMAHQQHNFQIQSIDLENQIIVLQQYLHNIIDKITQTDP